MNRLIPQTVSPNPPPVQSHNQNDAPPPAQKDQNNGKIQAVAQRSIQHQTPYAESPNTRPDYSPPRWFNSSPKNNGDWGL